MNPKVQTPNVDQIIGTGIDAFTALRPSGAPFVVSGHYGDIFAGWRAQLKLLNRRLVDECKSARLGLAEKRALLELASSEYNAVFSTDPQTAVGTATLTRPTAGAGGGVIKQGSRFRVDANPSANPAVQQAQYESVEPVVVTASGVGSGAGGNPIFVRVKATRPGPHANLPSFLGIGTASILLSDTLFDPTLVCNGGDAGGGSSGMSDDDIAQLARALYTGQYAPTNGAILAGALSSLGVKHGAVVQDNLLAQSVVFEADESWAYSTQMLLSSLQMIKNAWSGFGGRVVTRPVINQLVGVAATIQVTSPQYAADVLDIAVNVRTALRAYLDKRPDFYRFDLSVMGGIVAQSDYRILTCPSIVMTSLATGGVIAAPPALSAQSSNVYHYYLADNGLALSVSSPS